MMAISDVVDIYVTPTEALTTNRWIRKLVISNTYGETLRINLYADRPEQLRIEPQIE